MAKYTKPTDTESQCNACLNSQMSGAVTLHANDVIQSPFIILWYCCWSESSFKKTAYFLSWNLWQQNTIWQKWHGNKWDVIANKDFVSNSFLLRRGDAVLLNARTTPVPHWETYSMDCAIGVQNITRTARLMFVSNHLVSTYYTFWSVRQAAQQ